MLSQGRAAWRAGAAFCVNPHAVLRSTERTLGGPLVPAAKTGVVAQGMRVPDGGLAPGEFAVGQL